MRWVYAAGILIFFAYASWMIGPYLRSIIIRDAAVTSWTNLATSPIDGEVTFVDLGPDRTVGEDGVIAGVENEQLQRHLIVEAEARLALAHARVAELQNFLDDILILDQERVDLKARYADTFRAELDSLIGSLEREIEVANNRLGLLRRIAARNTKLAKANVVAATDADEANQRVWDMELELARLHEGLDHAKVRREAADQGVFITEDGEEPLWVRESRLDLKLHKKQVRLELRQAEAEVRVAQAELQTRKEDFRRLREDEILAPPGSIVWNERVAPGARVEAGAAVAEWLDCASLLIDVPVADAQVPLIKPGMVANVILEGDKVKRQASVLLTRGSALTLGRDDLAGLAKGRHEGVAQVLLDFSHERESFESCPVGRAAYVDFPDVGLIDVVRARLRL